MKVVLMLILTSAISCLTNAQSLAVNSTGSAANSSAMLDVSSPVKGLLIPRVALLAKNDPSPVTSPVESLLIYNTVVSGTGVNVVTPGYYYWSGSQWIRQVTDYNEMWAIGGNVGTNPSNNFIGTTDGASLRILTNSLPAMYFMNNSNFVGIGDENPGENLVIRLNTRAVFPVPGSFSGLQIKPTAATFGNANTYGLHIGLDNSLNKEGRIMNYEGDLWLGTLGQDVLHFKSTSRFTGINETNPQDNLTITLNPAAVFSGPDNYSGILLHKPGQAGFGNNFGLHIGLDNTNLSTARLMNSENGDLLLGTNKVEMMRLRATDRYIGVNTSTPYHSLSLLVGSNAIFTTPYDGLCVTTPNNAANANAGLVVGSDPAAYVNKGIWNYDNGYLAFGTNNLERIIITNAGNVGIGTSTPSEKLQVIGNILASGTITPSDLRYKKNIEVINNPLAGLQHIRGVRYDFKTAEFPDMGFAANRQLGLIAQEVEAVFPELVFTGKNGYKAVDYPKMTAVLVEAVKQLQKQIESQQKQLTEQQTLLNRLNGKAKDKTEQAAQNKQ